MRKTQRELSRLYSGWKVGTPGAVAAILLTVIGTSSALKFTGKMTIDGNTYELATDAGKVKAFSNVDDALKFAAKVAEKGNGVYTVEVDTGAVLASKVPNDMKAFAESQIVRLAKAKVSQNAIIDEIDADLTLMVGWEVGNAAQQAKKIEVQAQRAAVVTDVAAIDAEVARLTVIANA